MIKTKRIKNIEIKTKLSPIILLLLIQVNLKSRLRPSKKINVTKKLVKVI